MEGPGEIRTGRSTAPRVRGALRVLQTIVVWLAILGLFAGLGYGVWLAVKDSPARIDETLVRARAAELAACTTEPVVAPELSEPAPLPEEASSDLIPVVAAPRWRERPRPHYPMSDGDLVAGSVNLRCDVSSDGDLSGCDILEEKPQGHGFGAAAVEAAHRAKMCPRTPDGAPTPGTARFTIRFRPG